MELAIGQDVFCDCGMDILEYTVKELRVSAEGDFYVLRSKKGVGQHSWIEVIVFINKEGDIRYFELNETEMGDCEYGLEPFTNGKYFTSLDDAKRSFAKAQIALIEEDTRKLVARCSENDRRVAKWAAMIK